MKNDKNNLTRRRFFPLLGSALMIPVAAKAQALQSEVTDEEFEVLLKPDGTTVKVRKSVVKQAPKKGLLSNNKLLNWLKK